MPSNEGFTPRDDKKPQILVNTPEGREYKPNPGFTSHETDFSDMIHNVKVDNGDFDSKAEEGRNKGHAIARHVDKSQEYLEGRLPKLEGGAATSYPDFETANQVTSKVLEANKKEVLKWFKEASIQDKAPGVFKKSFDQEVGYGIRRGEKELSPRSKARVILRKISDNEFSIKSSFPID